ncbi:MAG: cytochrome P450 [Chloroflexota bacterium]|nr:cytochrome P450 [Chloroflexota bacterium]
MPSVQYPPGTKGTFVTGSAGEFAAQRLDFIKHCREQYGDMVYFRLFNRHAYLLNDPDHVRFVLVEHPELFHKTPLFKKNTRSLIGNGLLTSEGDFHKRQRKLAQPAFHHQRINAYGEVMVDYTRRMLADWQAGQRTDIHDAMMHLTMAIVARTLFNADVTQEAAQLGEAITAGLHYVTRRTAQPLALPNWVPTPANRTAKRHINLLNGTIDRIIAEHRASGVDSGDLLSMLMEAQDENGEQMDDVQLRHEAMTIFIAGHETTANALTWALYLVTQHPDVERRLQEEVDAFDGAVLTTHDLARLPYTDMIIKETMRLYPPAWIVPRLAIADFELGGYRIRKDSVLFTSPYTMQRHPRYYEQPERFIPERWTSEMEKALPKYAYFPFGGGPRVCIGNGFAMLEARLILATIAQRWQLVLETDSLPVPEPVVTLRPKHGIWMRPQLRQTQAQLLAV